MMIVYVSMPRYWPVIEPSTVSHSIEKSTRSRPPAFSTSWQMNMEKSLEAVEG